MKTRKLTNQEKRDLKKYLMEHVEWTKQECDVYLLSSIRPRHHWSVGLHKDFSSPSTELQIIDWKKEIEINKPYFSDVKVGDRVWDYDRGWGTVESVTLDFEPHNIWYQETPIAVYFDKNPNESGRCYNLAGGAYEENTTDSSKPYVRYDEVKSQKLFRNSVDLSNL